MFLIDALNAQDLINAVDYATDKRSYTCGVNIVRWTAPTGTLELIARSAGSKNAWTQRIQIPNIELLVDFDDDTDLEEYSGDEAAWFRFVEAYPDVVLADIKVGCSCPAFQYWGSAYIVDNLDSGEKSLQRYDEAGFPEGRFPSVRDIDLERTLCKHLTADLRKFFV